ncbi:hypothetical protein EYF80_012681 [Liparis tanakae]|uniref:Uncharacterized protein n=1 Tax=Liparis tanakae TaxID=230148 RepID=A0A4Z2IIJ9_9TELE|nr:hypothetical protein EYF80_012681 [Liparis tanakae]
MAHGYIRPDSSGSGTSEPFEGSAPARSPLTSPLRRTRVLLPVLLHRALGATRDSADNTAWALWVNLISPARACSVLEAEMSRSLQAALGFSSSWSRHNAQTCIILITFSCWGRRRAQGQCHRGDSGDTSLPGW